MPGWTANRLLDAMLDAVNDAVGPGALLRYYSGPHADGATPAGTLIGEVELRDPPFLAASGGTIEADSEGLSFESMANAEFGCVVLVRTASPGAGILDARNKGEGFEPAKDHASVGEAFSGIEYRFVLAATNPEE